MLHFGQGQEKITVFVYSIGSTRLPNYRNNEFGAYGIQYRTRQMYIPS